MLVLQCCKLPTYADLRRKTTAGKCLYGATVVLLMVLAYCRCVSFWLPIPVLLPRHCVCFDVWSNSDRQCWDTRGHRRRDIKGTAHLCAPSIERWLLCREGRTDRDRRRMPSPVHIGCPPHVVWHPIGWWVALMAASLHARGWVP